MAKKNAVGAKGARLLRRVVKHILAKPRRFQMDGLILRADYPGDVYTDDVGNRTKFESCGTAACIAGWATLLTDGIEFTGDTWSRGKELIGLDEEKAARLFLSYEWGKFNSPYNRAKTPRKRAKIAAERIEHFIKTGE